MGWVDGWMEGGQRKHHLARLGRPSPDLETKAGTVRQTDTPERGERERETDPGRVVGRPAQRGPDGRSCRRAEHDRERDGGEHERKSCNRRASPGGPQ
ncbi:hypothetical protein LZ30DRAFT_696508 [Colletotrichum cereale]|nr:hypothetical protein LZ30DRAFT_696508 [Colletotrichum cereale]